MSTPPNTTALAPAQPPTGVVSEGFGAIEKQAQLETAAQVLAEQAKAAVQARYIMAMKNPRDWDVVRQKLLKECERPSFAGVARYSKPVGAGTVTGPSIRYVEAALKVMGNVMPEQVVLYDDRQKRIIRVTVTDLEANLTYSKEILLEKTVERKQLKPGQTPLGSRINSRGERVYLVEATEDEMLIKEAALTSKAMRQLGLRIVPGDLVDECMETVLATVRRKAAEDPDAEKKAIIDSFDDLGVRVTDLKDYLGVDSLDTLTPKDLVNLRAVYQALRDGETNWREIMEQRDAVRGTTREEATGSRTSAVLDAVRAAQGTAVAAPQAASAAPEQADTPQGTPEEHRDAQAERSKGKARR
ncbi:MAG: hypothetical protein K6U02_04880 [Firmicutes bacterium]|nr:hypothetical protein [Bacillota bacterium]